MTDSQPAGYEIRFVRGDGDVYDGETFLAAVQYELRVQTELLYVDGQEVEGARRITGTISVVDRTRLPTGTDLLLLLEGGRSLLFRVGGSWPEYEVTPLGRGNA